MQLRKMVRFLSPKAGVVKTQLWRILCVLMWMMMMMCPFDSLATHIKHHHVPGLFVFGDSLVDAGNNPYIPNSKALTNFPPYGHNYFHKPTGRFSNGRTLVDFLAQKLKLPLVPPSLQPNASFKHGANFASGGSGLLDSTGASQNVLSFNTQVTQYLKLRTSSPSNLISESIYAFATGSNDIGANYLRNQSLRDTTSPQAFVTTLMEEYEKGLRAIYNSGGRKIILFGVGPLGCTPAIRLSAFNTSHGECLESVNQLAEIFNVGLTHMASKLRDGLGGATVLVASLYNLTDVIHHPNHYGFTNSTFACCGEGLFNTAVSCGVTRGLEKPHFCRRPSKYVFWDSTHPTEHMYRLTFNHFWHGNRTYVQPFNLQSLAFFS